LTAPVVDPTTGEVLGFGAPEGDEPDELDTADVDTLRRLAKAYRHQADGLKGDVKGLEQDVRAKNRRIESLKDELDEQQQKAPEAQTVRMIFAAWVEATERNRKRTKLGPAREKAVLARLREGHDADRILQAVKYGVKGANVAPRERERLALIAALEEATRLLPEAQATAVRNTYKKALGKVQVYDDLELICRNEVNLERFAAMGDLFAPPTIDSQDALDV
jgi:hypothetical protein